MKQKIQSFGRFLSGMVMPNIGAFIAWGLLTALFIATGWLPNEKLSSMVSPMLTYVLPVLIAYQGGKMVGGPRGSHGRHCYRRRDLRLRVHDADGCHDHGSLRRLGHQTV